MSNPQNSEPIKLVNAGDQHISLASGALSYLVRHSFRERIFEFKEPYPDELAQLGGTLVDLIELAASLGWFKPATAVEIATHWASVNDLKAALVAAGLPARGKRSDLLAACLTQCSDWVDRFAAKKPAYYPTDKGRIELQATRPVVVPQTKKTHLMQMRGYFDRDLNEARQSSVILGIKIWEREDRRWAEGPCPFAERFVGVYLPDEVPELYPDECPDDSACTCMLREMVLTCDETPEAQYLRDRLAARKCPP